MSLEHLAGGRPVHIPANPNKFQFDAEVSAIFEDMAARSIPNFFLTHEVHSRMLRQWLTVPDVRVLDIGASRGSFIRALKKEYPEHYNDMDIVAVDASPAMCKYMADEFPEVEVRCEDITNRMFGALTQQADVVCLHYVLQFIPPEHQLSVLSRVAGLVKGGGILAFGHKSAHYGDLGELAHEEYIRFRMSHGYSREEIEAKSKALKGAMYPVNHEMLKAQLLGQLGFVEIQETTRFMMFSSFLARKGND